MENSNEKLIEEFKRISKKGWIKCDTNSHGGIGLIFERELGKSPDSLYFPDYYGTEIKCTSRFSRYPLYLFTLAFDGPTFPEINRIVEKFGVEDKDFKEKKVLFVNVNGKENTNSKYIFKLETMDDKLYLAVYDLFGELIEKESYVYLESVYNHFSVKLAHLAIVYASMKKENGEKFYRYYKIILYKAKDFDTFIKLLTDGKIKVELISRISKSGSDKGRYRNKNLVFSIPKDNIDMLFDKIYTCDTDNAYNFAPFLRLKKRNYS